MRNYIVSGFLTFGSGQTHPLAATATLEDHEVMDLATVAKVQRLLLDEHNSTGTIATSLRITSFQPYETHETATPRPDVHLNECGMVLPPVDAPLLIEVAPGVLVQATRATFAQHRNDQLSFELAGGGAFTGRPRWTYP